MFTNKEIEEKEKLKKESINEVFKEAAKDDKEIVNNTKNSEIKKSSQEIKQVKKEEIEKVLKAINGVAFKFGDCIFKVTYTNIGQRRFSATCINEES